MGCDRRCHEIGGPWITFDPECPVHGYDAQREAEQLAAEEAAKDERLSRLEARLAAAEREIQLLRTHTGMLSSGFGPG